MTLLLEGRSALRFSLRQICAPPRSINNNLDTTHLAESLLHAVLTVWSCDTAAWGFDARDGNEQTREIQSLRSSTYTLIFLSHTLRLKDLYIKIRSCGPSLPISLSVSLTGSAEITGSRCQPPTCFHLRSPTQHPSRRSLSLSFSSTLSE